MVIGGYSQRDGDLLLPPFRREQHQPHVFARDRDDVVVLIRRGQLRPATVRGLDWGANIETEVEA